jgi:uncharacterized protein YqeY
MNLEQKVMQKIKEAMKAKDSVALEALRAIKSAILLEKTKLKGKELTEAEEMKILQKLIKQRKDSAEIYKQQNREDLAQAELDQVAVIEQFLPPPMSRDEVEVVIYNIIDKLGATSMKDMGKVMAEANKELAGKTDGKTISEIVKAKLSN